MMYDNHYDTIIAHLERGLVAEFQDSISEHVALAKQMLSFPIKDDDDCMCMTPCILSPRFLASTDVEDVILPNIFLGYGSTAENPDVETPGVNYQGETFTVSLYLVLGENPEAVWEAAVADPDIDTTLPMRDDFPDTAQGQMGYEQAVKTARDNVRESLLMRFSDGVYEVDDLDSPLSLARNAKLREMPLLKQASLFQHSIKRFIRLENVARRETIDENMVFQGATSKVRLANVQRYEENISSREFLRFDIAFDVYFPIFNPEVSMMM